MNTCVEKGFFFLNKKAPVDIVFVSVLFQECLWFYKVLAFFRPFQEQVLIMPSLTKPTLATTTVWILSVPQ